MFLWPGRRTVLRFTWDPFLCSAHFSVKLEVRSKHIVLYRTTGRCTGIEYWPVTSDQAAGPWKSTSARRASFSLFSTNLLVDQPSLRRYYLPSTARTYSVSHVCKQKRILLNDPSPFECIVLLHHKLVQVPAVNWNSIEVFQNRFSCFRIHAMNYAWRHLRGYSLKVNAHHRTKHRHTSKRL